MSESPTDALNAEPQNRPAIDLAERVKLAIAEIEKLPKFTTNRALMGEALYDAHAIHEILKSIK